MQSVVNQMLQQGLVSLPIPSNDPDLPIVQYADDTLLIVQADETQLLALKNMLITFSKSIGLKVNFHKSCIFPINVAPDEAIRLAAVFGCQGGGRVEMQRGKVGCRIGCRPEDYEGWVKTRLWPWPEPVTVAFVDAVTF